MQQQILLEVLRENKELKNRKQENRLKLIWPNVFVSCNKSYFNQRGKSSPNFKDDSYVHALSRVFQILSKENDRSREGSENLKNIFIRWLYSYKELFLSHLTTD